MAARLGYAVILTLLMLLLVALLLRVADLRQQLLAYPYGVRSGVTGMKEPTVAISHPSPGINWRRLGVRVLGLWTALYLTVLYVPFLIMAVLSFTNPNGGPTFPMQGVSLYWYGRLFNLTSPGSLGEGFAAYGPDIRDRTSVTRLPL